MADVLEHMPFPKTGLIAARRLLAPGGALFLSMPNMDTMVWRLLHANKVNPYWGEIEHYHNFSRKRLYALLESTAFSQRSMTSASVTGFAWRWLRSGHEPAPQPGETPMKIRY